MLLIQSQFKFEVFSANSSSKIFKVVSQIYPIDVQSRTYNKRPRLFRAKILGGAKQFFSDFGVNLGTVIIILGLINRLKDQCENIKIVTIEIVLKGPLKYNEQFFLL